MATTKKKKTSKAATAKKAAEKRQHEQEIIAKAKKAGRGGRPADDILRDAQRKAKMAGKGKESRPEHSDVKVKVGKKTYYI